MEKMVVCKSWHSIPSTSSLYNATWEERNPKKIFARLQLFLTGPYLILTDQMNIVALSKKNAVLESCLVEHF
jgi:hypothetical protein